MKLSKRRAICYKKRRFFSQDKKFTRSYGNILQYVKIFIYINFNIKYRSRDIGGHLELLTGINTKIKDYEDNLRRKRTFLREYVTFSEKFNVTITPPPMYWADERFSSKIKSLEGYEITENDIKTDEENPLKLNKLRLKNTPKGGYGKKIQYSQIRLQQSKIGFI